jgi:predicted DNA-binding protein (MmcQ/YjbR family)
MRLPDLRRFALSLPQTTWVAQWNGLVFKVAGKVFLYIGLDGDLPDGVVFKCTPTEFKELTDIDGIAQAPYFAKKHWVRVEDLAALKMPELQRRIRRSYDLVVANVTKKKQAEIAEALGEKH